MKDKCSDGEKVCFEGVVLGFDIVMDGWFGEVVRDDFAVVHSGGDVEVDGIMTVMC